MKCFYYAFIGMLLAIVVGFGLVWLFQRFTNKVVP